MNIWVNGDRKTVLNAEVTLSAFLAEQGYSLGQSDGQSRSNSVVAVNGVVVSETELSITRLSDNDQIDVVGVITGG